jgi:hypothetical protein
MQTSLPMAQKKLQVRRLAADGSGGQLYGCSAPTHAAAPLAALPHVPSMESLAEIEDG